MKTTYAILAAAVAVCALASPASAQQRPIAITETGKLRGVTAGKVESFKNIPFAAPPVGALRWHAPVAAAKWAGVRDASVFGHDCMQKPFPSDAAPLGTVPAEDCLVLNVWRPAGTPANAALPVVVWLYGGGFVNGGSSPAVYDGSSFARAGVLFVSINYRLGRFGFFAHPALTAAREGPAGNWGLMDQQAALKWIGRNIAGFGGDPARVTIVGESAGGMSVMALIGAPAARGTFAQAVVMSGGGRADGRLRQVDRDLPGLPSAATIGMNFARGVGVEGTDAAALTALRALPAERIVGDLNLARMSAPGMPTYSGMVEDGITVTGSTEQVFARRAQAPVPVMVGATSADIGMLSARSKEEAFAAFGAGAAAARSAYDPEGTSALAPLVTRIGSDRLMVEPARYIARQVVAAGQRAYLYRFSYVAGSMAGEWTGGAPHATDIPYFFDTVAAKYGNKLTSRDAALARAAHQYLVSFAKTGMPVADGAPAWPVFNGEAIMDLASSGKALAGPDPWEARLDAVEHLAGTLAE